MFHNLLTRHPDVCWLPEGCDHHPRDLGRFRSVFRWVDLPLVGQLLRRRFEPVEGYGFWDEHFAGFGSPCRDLGATDVTPPVRESLRGELAKLCTVGRPRLVLKVTGWPRVGFLREVFPDTRFIHVVRDGRSVAESLLRMRWWWGWRGPENWRFGPLTREEQDLWERHDRSFVALAGIEWSKLMRAMEEARGLVADEEWLTVRYEDFCQDPVRTFEVTQRFGALGLSESFLRHVAEFPVRSQNPRWKASLSDAQQRVLQDVVAEYLQVFGYV